MTESIEILKTTGLRITEARRKILDIFLETVEAMTIGDIEKKSMLLFDKATFYRTLSSFLKRKIIVRIPTVHCQTMYALNLELLSNRQASNEDVYFVCVLCDKTMCMQEVNVPKLVLPKGYQPIQTVMSVKGICEECKVSNTYYPTAS